MGRQAALDEASAKPEQRPNGRAVFVKPGEEKANHRDKFYRVNRSGYPSSRTLDGIISELPMGGYRSFLERVGSLTFNGQLLRDLSYRNLTNHERESRGAPQFLEVLTLARGLAFLNYGGCIAKRALHPDFEICLPDGNNFGVEVTDAFRTAAYEGRLQNLRLAIIDRIRSDELSLGGRLIMLSFRAVMETGVAMNLGHEPNVPDEAIPYKRSDLAAFLLDFANWISAGRHLEEHKISDEFTDDHFPELKRWNVMLSSSVMTETSQGIFDVFLPHVGQSASQIRRTIETRISRKQQKAVAYGLHRPLWLFVEIADRAIRAPRALEELFQDGNIPIAPFERVVVIHQDAALDIQHASITRMDTSSSHRELRFWPGLP